MSSTLPFTDLEPLARALQRQVLLGLEPDLLGQLLLARAQSGGLFDPALGLRRLVIAALDVADRLVGALPHPLDLPAGEVERGRARGLDPRLGVLRSGPLALLLDGAELGLLAREDVVHAAALGLGRALLLGDLGVGPGARGLFLDRPQRLGEATARPSPWRRRGCSARRAAPRARGAPPRPRQRARRGFLRRLRLRPLGAELLGGAQGLGQPGGGPLDRGGQLEDLVFAAEHRPGARGAASAVEDPGGDDPRSPSR